MMRIINLRIINGIIEFDYYVEDDKNDNGHVRYDMANKKLIENKRNPSDEKYNTDYSALRAMQFAWRMLETGETERLFCFY